VDSAVVRLDLRNQPPAPRDVAALEAVTQAAFGQRRKMLRSSLKALGGEALCEAAGVDPQRRAETLDLAEFTALAQAWLLRRGTV
jgi:16S rRNA (adenine1518-N6/adenine1519-N6)-dimethyltransferase